ncbi:hypothetical protein POPTR_015G143150v4 [Populus trichocarpa]|uniref:Uncharacterized protein n=1 Tax=Populus trichocarpa TaxID=3694 RepID=A0ACC0RYS4_POPTR|nr:hypothetical protein POPTR_015G143150v4 [Populus trichocarpa]
MVHGPDPFCGIDGEKQVAGLPSDAYKRKMKMKMAGGLQFVLESFKNQFTPQNNIEIWIYISIVLKYWAQLMRRLQE